MPNSDYRISVNVHNPVMITEFAVTNIQGTMHSKRAVKDNLAFRRSGRRLTVPNEADFADDDQPVPLACVALLDTSTHAPRIESSDHTET